MKRYNDFANIFPSLIAEDSPVILEIVPSERGPEIWQMSNGILITPAYPVFSLALGKIVE